MQHIKSISTIGPKNVQLLDTYKGEISVGNGKVLIDKKVIDKIKFIKEGMFVEKEGAPALRLVGHITGLIDASNTIPSDQIYPLFTKDLQEKLGVNSHDIKCILWKLNIKGNPKYHSETKTGRNSNWVNKYSENLIEVLKRMLDRPDFLKTCRDEYKSEIMIHHKRKRN